MINTKGLILNIHNNMSGQKQGTISSNTTTVLATEGQMAGKRSATGGSLLHPMTLD